MTLVTFDIQQMNSSGFNNKIEFNFRDLMY